MPDETPKPEAPKPLLPVQPPEGPAAGGWAPKQGTTIWAAVFVGVAGSTVPVLIANPLPYNINLYLAAVLGGAAGAVGTYLGLRSAGSRQP